MNNSTKSIITLGCFMLLLSFGLMNSLGLMGVAGVETKLFIGLAILGLIVPLDGGGTMEIRKTTYSLLVSLSAICIFVLSDSLGLLNWIRTSFGMV